MARYGSFQFGETQYGGTATLSASSTASPTVTTTGVVQSVGLATTTKANYSRQQYGDVRYGQDGPVAVADQATTAVTASATAVPFPLRATGAKLYIDRLTKGREIIGVPVSSTPSIRRGETASFELRIKDDRQQDRTTNYDRVKDLEEYAGFAQTGGTLSSVYFSESSTYPDSSVDTLLVRIEPGNKIDTAGVWGVVESVEDETQVLATGGRLTLDVFVLDRLSEYSDKQAVRNELEI